MHLSLQHWKYIGSGSTLAKCRSLAAGRLTHRRTASQSAAAAGAGEHTALYDFHVQHGGKVVNFGGYALPVQYQDQGIPASHLHTRRSGSIFDVSHMLQTYVRGKDALACIESICTADLQGAVNNSGTLTVFTNASGGILDDLIVTKLDGESLYIVSNAAMKVQDMDLMETAVRSFKSQGKDVSIEFLPTREQSLLAVQGPRAASVLSNVLPAAVDLNELYFMHTIVSEIAGVPGCRITRCGYTGEDGFELSVPSAKVRQVAEALLADPQLKLAGLGARDSLRLEAGLCLYGTDINAHTTPIEAGLAWLVAKRRRAELNFPGAQTICDQLKAGVSRRRVGFVMEGSHLPPARHGVEIYHNGDVVGEITSGCPSPSLRKNIAMGYIAEQLKTPGSLVQFKIRNKFYDVVVSKMPFMKTFYYLKQK